MAISIFLFGLTTFEELSSLLLLKLFPWALLSEPKSLGQSVDHFFVSP